MRRLALRGLVLMAVFALAAGGAFAGEQKQTQQMEGPCYCYCQDGECPGCDCPCGECLDCLQNRAGECFGWQGEPVDPWEQLMWQWMWMGGE
jgi:hypothetical protein